MSARLIIVSSYSVRAACAVNCHLCSSMMVLMVAMSEHVLTATQPHVPPPTALLS